LYRGVEDGFHRENAGRENLYEEGSRAALLTETMRVSGVRSSFLSPSTFGRTVDWWVGTLTQVRSPLLQSD
jgi:hypothetical protein